MASRAPMTLSEIAAELGVPETDLRGWLNVVGAKGAADILNVAGPNLYKLSGLPEPHAKLANGPVWFTQDIRAFHAEREERNRVKPLWRCRRHGTEDVRVTDSGRTYCAVCSNERAVASNERRAAAKRAAA